ncbi:hypothetical protein B0H16DRAFT_1478878 [Mycena metata]|uniref:Uncharacterized protein n=1 Tax=Mycena metata TaxID=1033252 RepID=A0AAD7MEC7_9AGAR|nr:hypothetical protein B0H16DRAFT_1478878 [Mycena metata]
MQAARDEKWRFRDWLETLKHRQSPPPPEPPSLNGWAIEWALQEAAKSGWDGPNPPVDWEAKESPWGCGAWQGHSAAPLNFKDPTWDGVTRVPKTPGNRKRQRQRKRERAAANAAALARWQQGLAGRQNWGAWEEYHRGEPLGYTEEERSRWGQWGQGLGYLAVPFTLSLRLFGALFRHSRSTFAAPLLQVTGAKRTELPSHKASDVERNTSHDSEKQFHTWGLCSRRNIARINSHERLGALRRLGATNEGVAKFEKQSAMRHRALNSLRGQQNRVYSGCREPPRAIWATPVGLRGKHEVWWVIFRLVGEEYRLSFSTNSLMHPSARRAEQWGHEVARDRASRRMTNWVEEKKAVLEVVERLLAVRWARIVERRSQRHARIMYQIQLLRRRGAREVVGLKGHEKLNRECRACHGRLDLFSWH